MENVYDLLLVHVICGGGARVSVVEALRYKPEGRGFESRWGHWIFQLT
jgi:hypothetical protein